MPNCEYANTSSLLHCLPIFTHQIIFLCQLEVILVFTLLSLLFLNCHLNVDLFLFQRFKRN